MDTETRAHRFIANLVVGFLGFALVCGLIEVASLIAGGGSAAARPVAVTSVHPVGAASTSRPAVKPVVAWDRVIWAEDPITFTGQVSPGAEVSVSGHGPWQKVHVAADGSFTVSVHGTQDRGIRTAFLSSTASSTRPRPWSFATARPATPPRRPATSTHPRRTA